MLLFSVFLVLYHAVVRVLCMVSKVAQVEKESPSSEHVLVTLCFKVQFLLLTTNFATINY